MVKGVPVVPQMMTKMMMTLIIIIIIQNNLVADKITSKNTPIKTITMEERQKPHIQTITQELMTQNTKKINSQRQFVEKNYKTITINLKSIKCSSLFSEDTDNSTH